MDKILASPTWAAQFEDDTSLSWQPDVLATDQFLVGFPDFPGTSHLESRLRPLGPLPRRIYATIFSRLEAWQYSLQAGAIHLSPDELRQIAKEADSLSRLFLRHSHAVAPREDISCPAPCSTQ
jgi:hypothetical protein